MFHVPEVPPATVGTMTTLSPWADIDAGVAPVEEDCGLLAVKEWMVTKRNKREVVVEEMSSLDFLCDISYPQIRSTDQQPSCFSFSSRPQW